MESKVTLRLLEEGDGPALAGLSYSTSDSGIIRYTANYLIDAVQAVRALHGDMEGVVACAPGSRMVGVSLVRYGFCQYEGETLPYAMLGNIIVHPDYRGQGLARRIVEFQVERARQRIGAGGVLLSNLQRGNEVSEQILARFMDHTTAPLSYRALKTLPEPPPLLAGVSAGPLDESEYAQFADGFNEFNRPNNFHQPTDAECLRELIERSPLRTPFRHAYTAVDAQGKLLAGLVVTEEYRIKMMEIRGMPTLLRWADRLSRYVPRDGAVRQVYLDHMWFRPGQTAAARHLVDTVRWIWSGRATNISTFFDPRSPLGRLFPTRPWSVQTRSTITVSGPRALDPRRPVSPIY